MHCLYVYVYYTCSLAWIKNLSQANSVCCSLLNDFLCWPSKYFLPFYFWSNWLVPWKLWTATVLLNEHTYCVLIKNMRGQDSNWFSRTNNNYLMTGGGNSKSSELSAVPHFPFPFPVLFLLLSHSPHGLCFCAGHTINQWRDEGEGGGCSQCRL